MRNKIRRLADGQRTERVSGENVSMNSKSYCSESTGAIQVENILAGGKKDALVCVCVWWGVGISFGGGEISGDDKQYTVYHNGNW